MVGAISFGCLRHTREWGADTIGRLRRVAQIVGSAVARKRADLALRTAREENERLRRRLEMRRGIVRQEPLPGERPGPSLMLLVARTMGPG